MGTHNYFTRTLYEFALCDLNENAWFLEKSKHNRTDSTWSHEKTWICTMWFVHWVTSRKFCLLKLWLMMTSGMTSPAWRPCWTAGTMRKSSTFHIFKSVVDYNSCIVLLIMWSQSPLPLVVTTFSHLHNLPQFYSIVVALNLQKEF